MSQGNSTDNSISGETHVDSADGGAAVPSLTLAELNTYLGKDFKDKDSALKALKDTQSFVGKRKEDIVAEVRASQGANASSDGSSTAALEAQVRQLREESFYNANPQYKDLRDTISAMGKDPAEVVQTEAFKKVFEKVQVANDVQNTRSVVSSNQRLAQEKTHTDNAVAVANSRGSTKEDVANALLGGIKEAFDLGQ